METNTTITVTYDCPYRNICSDNGAKCETCGNNPKRSYYRPIEPPIPYIPYEPYYPYYPYHPSSTGQPAPIIWYGTTSTTESHYESTK